MPLNQLSNSIPVRNKQNISEIEGQGSPKKLSSPCKKSLVNQLKIKLSDQQFELKKLEEDCSLKIASFQKELVKQRNDKKGLIKQAKQKLEEEKNYYQNKLSLMIENHNKQLKQVETRVRMEVKQKDKDEKIKVKQDFQKKIQSLQIEIKNLEHRKSKQIESIKRKHQDSIDNLLKQNKTLLDQSHSDQQKQIQTLKENHRAEIQFYKQNQDFKSKQHGVIEKILIQKLKIFQADVNKHKLQFSQVGKDLQNKVQLIDELKRQKQKYRLDSIYWQRKHNKLQAQLTQKFNKSIQEYKTQYKQKLSQKIKQFAFQIESIQEIHKSSIKNYESQQKMMDQKYKNLMDIFKTVKSNEQDVQKIETLQMKLIKKQFQLQKEREDLKICKLELGNMDQILQKMFEEAKVRSLKTRKVKLPSLISSNQNKSMMDSYGVGVNKQRQRKFSIRQCNNYQNLSKNLKQKQNSESLISNPQ